MPNPKRPRKAKERPAEDLLAKPGMERLAEFTKKILRVPKVETEQQNGKSKKRTT